MSLIHHISIFLSRLCQKIWWKADTYYLSTLCFLYITNSWFIFFVQYLYICAILNFIFGIYCLMNSSWPSTNICAILNSIFGTLLTRWLWSTYCLWYFEFYFWYIVWTVDCGLLTLRYWLNLHVIFYSSLLVIYTKSSCVRHEFFGATHKTIPSKIEYLGSFNAAEISTILLHFLWIFNTYEVVGTF